MTMDAVQMISTVGFPIFAFLLIWYQSTTVLKQNTQAIKELSQMIRDRRL